MPSTTWFVMSAVTPRAASASVSDFADACASDAGFDVSAATAAEIRLNCECATAVVVLVTTGLPYIEIVSDFAAGVALPLSPSPLPPPHAAKPAANSKAAASLFFILVPRFGFLLARPSQAAP
ncbi:hypothetical protein [Paraburkholderia tropica]|uniref:hypothetical protein n=1 Tax=Paraburkholderia tropica TaxID=92647 RepID=UPI002AB62697|nr:hypothetical protein [Paraburkholderia tropica]